jgi:hypothetical protein
MPKFTSAEVEILSSDNTGPGIKSAQSRIGSLTKVVKSYYAEIAAAYLIMRKAVQIVTELTSAYLEQEAAVQDMDRALRSTGIYTPTLSKRLQELAGNLQEVTVYSDETIESATGLLQSFGDLSEEVLTNAIPMMLDFAKATKMGPDEAAKIFGKTLGSNTNALDRYGLELDKGMTQLQKLGSMQAWVNSHFRDASLIRSYADEFENIKNMAGEYKETLGRFILEAGHPFTEWLREMLKQQAGMQQMVNVIRLFGATTYAVFKLNSDIIQAFMGYVYATTQSLNILGTVAEKVLGGGLFSKAGRESMKQDLQNLGNLWTDYGKAVGNAFKTDIGKVIETYSKAFEKYDGTIKTTSGSLGTLGFETDRASVKTEELKIREIEYKDELVRATEALDAYNAMMYETDKAANNMAEGVQTASDAIAAFSSSTQPMIEELTAGQMALAYFKDYVENDFQPALVDAWESIWTSTGDTFGKIKEAFKDMVSQFLIGLAKLYAAQAVALMFLGVWGRAAKLLLASAGLYAAAQVVQGLQQGGYVKKQQGGMQYGDRVPAMLEPGEAVIPRRTVQRNAAAIGMMQTGGGIPVTIPIYLDGKIIARNTVDRVNRGQETINTRSVVKR